MRHLGTPPTLADLARRVSGLRAWCARCRSHAIVPMAIVVAKCGPAASIKDARARLRCSKCGSNEADLMPDWPTIGPIAVAVS